MTTAILDIIIWGTFYVRISVPGKRPLPGKCPCNCFGCSNGKHPLPRKRPGNMSQDHNDDEVNDNTYEDDADIDDLDLFLIDE